MVDVPLPSSSIITKLFLVASSQIALVSSSSTKKVDLFSRILSDFPNLVNTLSTTLRVHSFAATKQPIYAIIAARHVYLRRVLLPLIFGPVINRVDGV